MYGNKKWVLYLFFPITIYLFLGTTILFLLSKIEQLSEKLGDYSEFPGFDDFTAKDWHEKSIWLTALFPAVIPFIAIWAFCVFIYAIISAILKFIYNILVEIWEWIVDILKKFWDWFIETLEAIWTWTVETIEYIWDEIKNVFS